MRQPSTLRRHEIVSASPQATRLRYATPGHGPMRRARPVTTVRRFATKVALPLAAAPLRNSMAERDNKHMDVASLHRAILSAGERLGFRRIRAAAPTRLDRGEFLEQWLAEGRAGEMRFLLHHRKARLDPRTRYPWARTILSAFVPYPAPPPFPADWRERLLGRIAAYARAPDYHDALEHKLEIWKQAIRELAPEARVAGYTDTGAILEHEWAARSGVGWTGKHTLTLSEELGSYGFLAELLLSIELPPDEPVVERCGTCSRCLPACPTGAIEANWRLDPRLCISYLTIEQKGPIPTDLRPALGEWIFGCDLCQLACPWNPPASGESESALAPHLPALLRLDEAGFDKLYGRSAVRRTGRIGLARNAAVVLGNTLREEAIAPLASALAEHDAALVREHAAWGLGRLSGHSRAKVVLALERGLTDPAEAVREACREQLSKS